MRVSTGKSCRFSDSATPGVGVSAANVAAEGGFEGTRDNESPAAGSNLPLSLSVEDTCFTA